jgi:hypothetical protein
MEINREQAINELVKFDIQGIVLDEDFGFLDTLLREGHKGYEYLTIEQIEDLLEEKLGERYKIKYV